MIMNAKKQQVFLIVTKESVQCTSFSLSNVLPGTQRAIYLPTLLSHVCLQKEVQGHRSTKTKNRFLQKKQKET